MQKLYGLKEPSLFTLLLLISYPSVGAVLFTPALPAIAKTFQISPGIGQLSVNLFLIGYALGQLPYGPLSNKIGRKPTLYIGLWISIFGALLCAIAGILAQFWLLILARIITALGASVGLMMSLTIISDYYESHSARKKFSTLFIAFAITPGMAVALGGFLTQKMGWESTFFFQALYGLFVWILCRELPETSTTLLKEPFNLKSIYRSYLQRCNNQKLLVCSLIQGCCTSFVYIFAALGPFILIHILGLSAQTYGLLNLIPSTGMICGSILSRKTHNYLSMHKSILLALLLILPSSLAMLLFFLFGQFNIWTLFVPYFFINIGLTLAYINCPAIGTADAKNKPNASAVLGCINISVCVIMVFVLVLIDSQSPIWMPLLFTILLSILFPLYFRLEKMITSA